MLDFVSALRSANSPKLERFFGPGFEWFSVTDSPVGGHKRHFVGHDADEAIDYITERKGFKLSLSELVVTDTPGRHSDFNYNGVWAARGASWLFVGKGAITCRDRSVKVWSMQGTREKVERGPALCPRPADEITPRTLVVCLRGD